jgi:hypothetical protein
MNSNEFTSREAQMLGAIRAAHRVIHYLGSRRALDKTPRVCGCHWCVLPPPSGHQWFCNGLGPLGSTGCRCSPPNAETDSAEGTQRRRTDADGAYERGLLGLLLGRGISS